MVHTPAAGTVLVSLIWMSSTQRRRRYLFAADVEEKNALRQSAEKTVEKFERIDTWQNSTLPRA